jgi:hypothetical protein
MEHTIPKLDAPLTVPVGLWKVRADVFIAFVAVVALVGLSWERELGIAPTAVLALGGGLAVYFLSRKDHDGFSLLARLLLTLLFLCRPHLLLWRPGEERAGRGAEDLRVRVRWAEKEVP